MTHLKTTALLFLVLALALPVFAGNLFCFDESGYGANACSPTTHLGTSVVPPVFLSGGGIEWDTIEAGPPATGYYLVYDQTGTKLSDIVEFLPFSSPNQNADVAIRLYSLDNGGLPADTANPPSPASLALLGTLDEDASGRFNFINILGYTGLSPDEQVVPEPSSLLLLGSGLAALARFGRCKTVRPSGNASRS